MTKIRLRDKDTRDGQTMAIIETETTTVQEIQDIADTIRMTIDDYCISDLQAALPPDCKWVDLPDEEVWF